MKNKLSAHQETISILTQQKEAQIKLYKTLEDKELDKVIDLENKVKILDNIVYKTGQSIQTMNMLNSKCRTSFAKPEFLKKAQRANPRLYDIGCYNDNLALMLAPESDEVIRLEKEKRSRLSHTAVNTGNSKEAFNKQTTLLEKQMDESIPWDKKCKSSIEFFKIKAINAGLHQFHLCLQEEMVADLRYFNSLKLEVDSLRSQLETQKTQFLNEIDRLLREYYYADQMNAILNVYTELDEDKGIAISELKKLIEKLKGNSVDTKFEKSLVIRQLNAFKSQRPSILGKPTIFSDSLERKDFSKSKSVTKNSVSNDFSKPVTAQILPPNKKSILKNTNVLAPGILNDKTSNVNFVCTTCGKCVLNEKHDVCVHKSHNGVNSRTKMPMVVPISSREPKLIVNQSVAKPLRRKEIILFIVDSGCLKHMTRNFKLLIIFVEKFLGTVNFRNDQIAPILGYGDLVQRAVTTKRVYYIEGLNHNLFSVGQFCDADLEVAFQKSTCYIRDLKGNDLLTGSCGTYLYSITLQDSSSPNPICLMAKATSSQAWLWHHRLSHLNFDTINLLSKNDILIGLPKLKFIKDHLCSSCELGKAKQKSFQSKSIPSSKRRLQLLHMDLCGPMRVESINGKKYVLVIVDDYSRYTWTYFLRLKDETPEVLIDFLRLVQRGLHAYVRIIRTDKGTKFLSKTLHGDGENLDKMKEKGGSCIFVGYSTQSRAYRVFNKKTRVIVETIHVNIDELPQMTSDHDTETVTTSNELDLLFSPMFDELLNGSTQVVSMSSIVTTADVPNQYHPLEQVIGNPSQSVRTRRQLESDGEMFRIRRQLESDGEMCTLVLTVSRTGPKNIKESMADSAWIESMQEELYQFDRLDVWELVDRPLCKNVINM
nr:retrovirus-related Pol polyprotein from transposon TNT 1-94 [Tanacetum cinerariifolium]